MRTKRHYRTWVNCTARWLKESYSSKTLTNYQDWELGKSETDAERFYAWYDSYLDHMIEIFKLHGKKLIN